MKRTRSDNEGTPVGGVMRIELSDAAFAEDLERFLLHEKYVVVMRAGLYSNGVRLLPPTTTTRPRASLPPAGSGKGHLRSTSGSRTDPIR